VPTNRGRSLTSAPQRGQRSEHEADAAGATGLDERTVGGEDEVTVVAVDGRAAGGVDARAGPIAVRAAGAIAGRGAGAVAMTEVRSARELRAIGMNSRMLAR
jgi:hypothetical protein